MSDPLAGAEALLHMGEGAKGLLTLIALCTTRLYVAMLVLPATNDTVLQGVIRNGLALTLGTFIALGQQADVVENISTLTLVMLIAKEGLLGLLIGYGVSTVFWIAEGVGILVDNQAGYNNVQQSNPLSGEQSTPVGNMLSQLSISGFYMLGGMMVFAGLIFQSFGWWPLNRLMPDWSNLLETFLQAQVSGYLAAAMKLSSAVLIVLMLIDIGIGLISKTADKLEPNNLAQPIKGAVALLMVALLVSVFFDQLRPQLALHEMSGRLGSWLHRTP
jgi:type III secretion protein T